MPGGDCTGTPVPEHRVAGPEVTPGTTVQEVACQTQDPNTVAPKVPRGPSVSGITLPLQGSCQMVGPQETPAT